MSGARLLAVSHNLNLEGAPIYLLDILTGLRREGIGSATLLNLAEGPAASGLDLAGMALIDPPFPRLWLRSAEQIETAIDHLARWLREHCFDLVWANTFVAYPLVHAAQRAGVPVVWQIHESQADQFWHDYLGSRYPLALAAMAAASAVVFMAEATRALWRQRLAGEGAWHTLPYGLDSARFARRGQGQGRAAWRTAHAIPQEAVVCLNVGTLHERKGQWDLLQAVAAQPADSPLMAVCLGDRGGDYSDAIHTWLADLPAEQRARIRLLPLQAEVGDAYAAADMFVCCSRNESWPLVIFEALAVGLPIISTPVFGIAEQLRFGTDAIAYPPGDHPALAHVLAQLAGVPEQRQQWAAAARQRHAMLPTNPTYDRAYAALARGLLRPAPDNDKEQE